MNQLVKQIPSLVLFVLQECYWQRFLVAKKLLHELLLVNGPTNICEYLGGCTITTQLPLSNGTFCAFSRWLRIYIISPARLNMKMGAVRYLPCGMMLNMCYLNQKERVRADQS